MQEPWVGGGAGAEAPAGRDPGRRAADGGRRIRGDVQPRSEEEESDGRGARLEVDGSGRAALEWAASARRHGVAAVRGCSISFFFVSDGCSLNLQVLQGQFWNT